MIVHMAEAARRLNVSTGKIHTLVKKGTIPIVREGSKKKFIDLDSVDLKLFVPEIVRPFRFAPEKMVNRATMSKENLIKRINLRQKQKKEKSGSGIGKNIKQSGRYLCPKMDIKINVCNTSSCDRFQHCQEKMNSMGNYGN